MKQIHQNLGSGESLLAEVPRTKNEVAPSYGMAPLSELQQCCAKCSDSKIQFIQNELKG